MKTHSSSQKPGETIKILNKKKIIERVCVPFGMTMFCFAFVFMCDKILKLDKNNIWVEDTYSCYSNSTKNNTWGIGCGTCNSCWERKRAFEVLKVNYGGKI